MPYSQRGQGSSSTGNSKKLDPGLYDRFEDLLLRSVHRIVQKLDHSFLEQEKLLRHLLQGGALESQAAVGRRKVEDLQKVEKSNLPPGQSQKSSRHANNEIRVSQGSERQRQAARQKRAISRVGSSASGGPVQWASEAAHTCTGSGGSVRFAGSDTACASDATYARSGSLGSVRFMVDSAADRAPEAPSTQSGGLSLPPSMPPSQSLHALSGTAKNEDFSDCVAVEVTFAKSLQGKELAIRSVNDWNSKKFVELPTPIRPTRLSEDWSVVPSNASQQYDLVSIAKSASDPNFPMKDVDSIFSVCSVSDVHHHFNASYQQSATSPIGSNSADLRRSRSGDLDAENGMAPQGALHEWRPLMSIEEIIPEERLSALEKSGTPMTKREEVLASTATSKESEKELVKTESRILKDVLPEKLTEEEEKDVKDCAAKRKKKTDSECQVVSTGSESDRTVYTMRSRNHTSSRLTQIGITQEVLGKMLYDRQVMHRETTMSTNHHISESTMTKLFYRMRKTVASSMFNLLMGGITLVNAVYIGCQVEMGMIVQKARLEGKIKPDVKAEDVEDIDWFIYDVGFVILFGLELLLRIVTEQKMFCRGRDWAWNLFDSVITLMAIMEVIGWSSVVNVSGSALRVMRVIRVVRILRVLSATRRMPFLQNLQTMIVSLAGSLPALAPAVWILGLLIFFFGMFLMQGVENYLDYIQNEANYEDLLQYNDDKKAESGMWILARRFGSVHKAAATLFMCISGGLDWGHLQDALRDTGFVYEIFFVIYIFFAVFAVLNVLTGIFVEAAHKFSVSNRVLTADQLTKQEHRYIEDLVKIFADVDAEAKGKITWEVFENHFRSPEVRAYMRAMELDIHCVKKVFELIDQHNIGEIDVKDFVKGCVRLRGQAKAVDLAQITHKIDKIIYHLSGNIEYSFMGSLCSEDDDSLDEEFDRSCDPKL